MPKKIKKMKGSTKVKTFGTIIVGVFLFSTVITMFIFPKVEPVYADDLPFIKVKKGNFAFLDSQGYNFEFSIDIQQVKIIETKQVIETNRIVVECENSFGITTLIFDKLKNGNVKFTIDHQGNMLRSYDFKLTVLNNDLVLKEPKNLLLWDSGYCDYSDMALSDFGSFRLDRDVHDRYTLRMYFKNTINFWIDPLLSSQVSLDIPIVSEQANKTGGGFTTAYQPLFSNDELTDDDLGVVSKTEYYEMNDFGTGQSDFWIARLKNETAGVYYADEENITTTQGFFLSLTSKDRLLMNCEFDSPFLAASVANVSSQQWFSLPMLSKYAFTDVKMYINMTTHQLSPNNGIIADLDSNDALIVELMNHTISPLGFEYPVYGWNGFDVDYHIESPYAYEAEEQWNLPVISDVRAEYNFTGTESAQDVIEIDVTDLLQNWNQNFGNNYSVIGFHLYLTNWNDPTDPSRIYIGEFKLEYTFNEPNIIAGSNNPYWSNQGAYIIDEMSMIDQHLDMETIKVFPMGGEYIGGKNWYGQFIKGKAGMNITGEYTTDGVLFKAIKEEAGAIASNQIIMKIAMEGQGDVGDVADGGEYSIRFKLNDSYTSDANSDLTIGLMNGYGFSWDFGANTGSNWGIGYDDLFDDSWHELVFRYTDTGDFIEPYNHKFGISVFFDGQLVHSLFEDSDGGTGSWFEDYSQPILSIQYYLFDPSDTASEDSEFSIEIDYIAYQPTLHYRLSNDSTTGDYSLEAYSYDAYYSRDVVEPVRTRTFSDYIPDGSTNILGEWSFDYGTGIKAYEKYNGYHGNITGAVWVDDSPESQSYPAGDLHYSLDFEYSESDFVNITDVDDFSFTSGGGNDDPFSFSAWINIESDGEGYIVVLSKSMDLGITNKEYMIYIFSNQLFFSLYDGATDDITVSGSSTLINGNWHFIAVTYNGNNSESGLNLYVNGTAESLTSQSGGGYDGMTNTATPVLIGANLGNSLTELRYEFDGLIDQVKIFNYNLSASEVNKLWYEPDYSGHSSVGHSGGGANDITMSYRKADDGNITEGEELLRLVFGNYYRRFDEYVNGRDQWYSYASEGINLINYPILTFDIKGTFGSNEDNDTIFGQINDVLSNAYITLYNESMYPVVNCSWVNFGATGVGASDYLYIEEDLGFIVINDLWVSVRIDLRNMFSLLDVWKTDKTVSPLEAVGGIGFSFYFQQNNQTREDLVALYNNTEIAYSIKIDNLQFLPVQTVGSHGLTDYGENSLGDYTGGATANWNYDYVKEGDKSVRLNKTSGTAEIGMSFNFQSAGATNNIRDNGYILFWLYSFNEYLSFYNGDWSSFYLLDTDFKTYAPTMKFWYYGNQYFYDTSGSWEYVPLLKENWYLFALDIRSFRIQDLPSAGGSGIIKSLFIRFRAFDEPSTSQDIDFIIDGLSIVSSDSWDYTNLTLNDPYSGWTNDLLVNSTRNMRRDKGFRDNWDLFESTENDRTYNYNIDPDVSSGIDQWNEWILDTEYGYSPDSEGFESTQGYPLDFVKAESDSFRDDNLVAWYRMNEGTGNDVNDSSRNDHNGINNGADWVSNGDYGYALDFELGDTWDNVTISDSDDLSFGDGIIDSAFSVFAFVKYESVASNTILFKGGDAFSEGIEWRFSAGAELAFSMWNATNGDSNYIYSTTYYDGEDGDGYDMVTDTWYFVGATYDGSGTRKGIRFYVFGTGYTGRATDLTNAIAGDYGLVGSYTCMKNTPFDLSVGSFEYQSVGFWQFDGIIDEVMIFDKELTAAEVVAIHPDRYDGIVAKWKMDTGTGSIVYDSYGDHSGYGNGDWILNDIYGYSYNLSSVTEEEIHIAHSNDLSFTDGVGNDIPFSISINVRFNSIDLSDSTYLFSKRNTNFDDGEYQSFVQSDAIGFRLYEAGSGDSIGRWANFGSAYIETGVKYYFVFTYDGSEARTGLAIYLNGVRVDNTDLSQATYTGMSRTPSQNLTLGHANGSSLWYGNYHFDEFTIYDKELSAADVLSRYQEYERNSIWFFGSNVKSTISDSNTLFMDTIQETSLTDSQLTTNFQINYSKSIDWLYWNAFVIKVKNYVNPDDGQGGFQQEFVVMSGSGWCDTAATRAGWFLTGFNSFVCGIFPMKTFDDVPLFMNLNSIKLGWGSNFRTAAYDLEFDWIKLYHVETNFFIDDWNRNSDLDTLGWIDNDPVPMFGELYSYNSTYVIQGNNSFQIDFNKYRDEYIMLEETVITLNHLNKRFQYSNNRYSAGSERTSWNWGNATALEFWLRSNETLYGKGAISGGFYPGQMAVTVSSIVGTSFKTRSYYNITDHWIVNDPNGEYDGTLSPDFWYRFVIPFDEYNTTQSGWTLDSICSLSFRVLNGGDSWTTGDSEIDPFTSADGNYTLLLDGLRPIGFTYSVLDSSTTYDSNYQDLFVSDYSGSTFNFNMSTNKLLSHELKYLLNRNPSVSSYVGYLVNGSNQVTYQLNYSIAYESQKDLMDIYNHQFYILSSYSFFNVTLGNGTTKTVQEGFSVTNYNSTHKLVVTDIWENGTWTWHFITPNSVVYLDIDPEYDDGQQTNISVINYDIRIANGTSDVGLIDCPVTIEVKDPQDNILTTQDKLTGSNGWLNSSITDVWEMTSNKRLYLTVTGKNQSFLGYEAAYLLAFQDFDPPTIEKIEFEEKTAPKIPKTFYVTVFDVWTEAEGIQAIIYYGFVSSGSLIESADLSLVSGVFEVTLSGQSADTTIWFKFIVLDNLTNSFETQVFSAIWVDPPPTGDGDGDGDGDGEALPAAVAPSGGIAGSNWLLILIFALGAIFSAILIVGVYRRVTVRTRRVEEREVITVFGRTGQAKEKIEEKGN